MKGAKPVVTWLAEDKAAGGGGGWNDEGAPGYRQQYSLSLTKTLYTVYSSRVISPAPSLSVSLFKNSLLCMSSCVLFFRSPYISISISIFIIGFFWVLLRLNKTPLLGGYLHLSLILPASKWHWGCCRINASIRCLFNLWMNPPPAVACLSPGVLNPRSTLLHHFIYKPFFFPIFFYVS